MRKRLLNLLQIILVCSNCNKCDQRVSYCKKFFLLNYQRRAVCINTAQHKGQWTKISRGGSIDRPDRRLATVGMIWTKEEILWKAWYWSTVILWSKRSAIFLTIMKHIYSFLWLPASSGSYICRSLYQRIRTSGFWNEEICAKLFLHIRFLICYAEVICYW